MDDHEKTGWDVESEAEPDLDLADEEDYSEDVVSVAFNPDSSLLATASFNWSARIWDVTSGRLIHQLNHPGMLWHSYTGCHI